MVLEEFSDKKGLGRPQMPNDINDKDNVSNSQSNEKIASDYPILFPELNKYAQYYPFVKFFNLDIGHGMKVIYFLLLFSILKRDKKLTLTILQGLEERTIVPLTKSQIGEASKTFRDKQYIFSPIFLKKIDILIVLIN